MFKYIESRKNKTTTFRYISNIQVNDDNIDKVVKLGRQRWKIENEGFYTQKHRTFDITHLNIRNNVNINLFLDKNVSFKVGHFLTL